MKRYIRYTLVLAVIFSAVYFPVFAAINLKLPFPQGTGWTLTNGFGKDKDPRTTYHLNRDLYALDFALPGCDSFGKPTLAAASGTVVEIGSAELGNPYGNMVRIDHGEGLESLYAHLDQVRVIKNQKVVQGETIGTVGNTGNASGTKCDAHPGTHLHFAVRRGGKAYEPVGISGYREFKEGESYISDNADTGSAIAPVKSFFEALASSDAADAARNFSPLYRPIITPVLRFYKLLMRWMDLRVDVAKLSYSVVQMQGNNATVRVEGPILFTGRVKRAGELKPQLSLHLGVSKWFDIWYMDFTIDPLVKIAKQDTK